MFFMRSYEVQSIVVIITNYPLDMYIFILSYSIIIEKLQALFYSKFTSS